MAMTASELNIKLEHTLQALSIKRLKQIIEDYALDIDNEEQKYSLVCPITFEIMEEPYVANDGRTYEKSKIEQITGLGSPFNPSITIQSIIPNIDKKNSIATHLADILLVKLTEEQKKDLLAKLNPEKTEGKSTQATPPSVPSLNSSPSITEENDKPNIKDTFLAIAEACCGTLKEIGEINDATISPKESQAQQPHYELSITMNQKFYRTKFVPTLAICHSVHPDCHKMSRSEIMGNVTVTFEISSRMSGILTKLDQIQKALNPQANAHSNSQIIPEPSAPLQANLPGPPDPYRFDPVSGQMTQQPLPAKSGKVSAQQCLFNSSPTDYIISPNVLIYRIDINTTKQTLKNYAEKEQYHHLETFYQLVFQEYGKSPINTHYEKLATLILNFFIEKGYNAPKGTFLHLLQGLNSFKDLDSQSVIEQRNKFLKVFCQLIEHQSEWHGQNSIISHEKIASLDTSKRIYVKSLTQKPMHLKALLDTAQQRIQTHIAHLESVIAYKDDANSKLAICHTLEQIATVSGDMPKQELSLKLLQLVETMESNKETITAKRGTSMFREVIREIKNQGKTHGDIFYKDVVTLLEQGVVEKPANINMYSYR